MISEPATSHHSVMERRQAVSDWLETVVRERLRKELTMDTNSPSDVLSLLSGHCVMEACDKAYESGMYTDCFQLLLSVCARVSSRKL